MWSQMYYFVLVVIVSNVFSVRGQSAGKKVSLAFAIDDTGSMWNEIGQVKEKTRLIFDAVLNSEASQIENFVLLTFNDPGVRPAVVTTDENVFRNALNAISVGGGGDCPEMSMTGVEKVLMSTLPNSYIYVFTDASAKDYGKFAAVKRLAQKQGTQIVFLLTGMCGGESDVDFKVYDDLATATSGQVFHMEKDEITKILNYVIETIKKRRTVITDVKLKPGYDHTLSFPVDGETDNLHIAVSGKKPELEVFKPDGSGANTTDIFKNDRTIVVEVPSPDPGNYTAKVGSASETRAVVTGATDLTFSHGFSPLKPTSIKGTATRPIQGKPSYLAIEVSSKDNEVVLEIVELQDMKGNVLVVRPLDEIEKDFYVASKVFPPDTMFKIAVKGYVKKTKTPIRRLSSTPIEPQTPTTEEISTNRAPTVNIIGDNLREFMYDDPIQLQCKINGYPKPTVTWIDETTNVVLSEMIEEVDLPYDYISVLNIDAVKSNTSYQCRAVNGHGEDKKSVAVKAITKFIVVNVSKDMSLDYEDEGELHCLIDAVPPPEIKWYLNGDVMMEDDDMEKSANGSIITIKSMQPKFEGKYICEARNEFERKVFIFDLIMTGTAAPVIDDSIVKVDVIKHQNANIQCIATQGSPQPGIRWSFKGYSSQEFIPINGSSDIIEISNADIHNAGTYKCEAFNIVGSDEHEVELVVKYPPIIKDKTRKLVRSEEGKRLYLSCKVDGSPEPKVEWSFNGDVIKRSLHQRIYRDNTLSFIAKVNNSGSYLCSAVNELGFDNKITQVINYGPVKINPPVESSIKNTVGSFLSLPCEASGYPKPTIKWLFINNNETKVLRPSDVRGSLQLPRLQLHHSGHYICVAKNPIGSSNITYQVEVLAPPIIAKTSLAEKFSAVVGDLSLIVPCKASGNPKPTITWMKDDRKIPSGTEWYDIKEDGTLVMKNIDDISGGQYFCSAENSIGQDMKSVYVDVLPYPEPSLRPSILNVEEGKSTTIECDIPHKRSDKLRWYKDTEVVAVGELNLKYIRKSDEGLYTCRVSNFVGSTSSSKLVKVGYKPKFITDEREEVDFYMDIETYLYCGARAEPVPEVTWWHNGKKMNVSDMIYTLKMSLSDLGQYTCKISNIFGTITRNFKVLSNECLLNLTMNINSPAVSASDVRTDVFENNVLRIAKEELLTLSCPSGFVNFPGNEIEATCIQESLLNVNYKYVDFNDIKCNEGTPVTKRTGKRCARGNTETVKVGLEAGGSFNEAYKICYDNGKNIPIYSTIRLKRYLSDVEVTEDFKWFDDDLVRYNYDDLYECSDQMRSLDSYLIRPLKSGSKCCFAKRQLVNTHDISPGPSQIAAYSNLNLVPQWSTCGTENWDDLEKRIKALVKPLDRELVVRTGTSGVLQLPTNSSKSVVFLHDRDNKRQPIPMFLWKVVQDEYTKSSIAIIQVNVPDLALSEAYSYMLCKDICNDIEWMRNVEWRNVKKGYTYCCSITDFESAFGFKRLFSNGMEGILNDVSLISEHSLA